SLKRAGRQDDVARLPASAVGLEGEAIAVVGGFAEGRCGDTQPQGGTNVYRVLLEKLDDMVAMGKAVGLFGVVSIAGQRQRPIRELEGQRIPSLASPALRHAGPLDDHVPPP